MAAVAKLGVADAVFGDSLVIGYGTLSSPFLNLAAESTLVLSQAADVDSVRPGESTLSLSQECSVVTVRNLSASSTITLTQNDLAAGTQNLSASSEVVVTEEGESSLKTPGASNALSLQQIAYNLETFILDASSLLTLTDSSGHSSPTVDAASTLGLTSTVHGTLIRVNSIDGSGENTLSLDQKATVVHILSTAIDLSAASTLTLAQRAYFPLEMSIVQVLSLTQSATNDLVKEGEGYLILTQAANCAKSSSLEAESDLELSQTFTYEIGEINTKKYNPFSGPGGIASETPTLSRKNDIHLAYPVDESYTYELTLRTPDFGDRDRFQADRINRELKGGSIVIYADPTWPKINTLSVQISRVKSSLKLDVLNFLKNTLGRQIRLRDWENRVWHGVITNPDTAVITNSRDTFDVAIEFEGEIVT